MNISYYDFKNLPDCMQCQMALDQGQMMEERTLDQLKYVLYQISNFSVEIIYNTFSEKIAAFNVYQNRSVYAQ